MPKAAAPADASIPTGTHQLVGSATKTSIQLKAPIFATLTVLASALALAVGVAPRESGAGLARDLSTLATAWQTPSAHQRVEGAGNRRQTPGTAPEVGDEGFWLSRHELTSQAAGLVAVGDRISISEPLSGNVNSNTQLTRVFEVIELKPLASAIAAVSATTGDKSHSLAEPEATLTIVVCREQASDTNATPRTIRFLMETTPVAAAAGPVLPRTL